MVRRIARSPSGRVSIGKAARERVAITASRQAEEYHDFLKQLVGDWSYTEEEARTLSADRRSWMGVPILGAGTAAIAVVYLDSSVQDFFTAQLQQLVMNACSGIADYIVEAY